MLLRRAEEDEAVEEGAAGAPGIAHREAAIHRVCHAPWPPGDVAKLLATLREIPMPPETLKQVMGKALRMCRAAGSGGSSGGGVAVEGGAENGDKGKGIDLQSLPSVMHQLLLMAQAGQRTFLLKASLKKLISSDL